MGKIKPNKFLPLHDNQDYHYSPLSETGPPSPTSTTTRLLRPKKLLLTLVVVFLFVALIFGNKRERQDRYGCNNIHEESGMHASPEILKPARSKGAPSGVSEKTNNAMFKDGRVVEAYPWNCTMLSWQRTAFHFQPEKNWMNDPNGPLYYKGWYHLFYQYNPIAAVWGNIVWGHAASKDLINWFYLPLAMVADQWYDLYGVWTGSATILPDGKLIMLYTGSTNESVQVQNLAYPEDPNDPLLVKWVKYPGNPVLFPPPGIGFKDFRDPTTAWLTAEGKWRITIGSRLDKNGISLIYDTENFVNFDLQSHVLHGVPGTGMWECVDFYPVSKTTESGLDTSVNGPEVKHVVKVSLDKKRKDSYAIGTYFDSNGTWYPDNPEIDVGIGLRYDYGVFYASKTFYDLKKERRVLWGWIGESDSEYADNEKGWASLQGIPRTVVLDRKTGTNLLQWPVEEVEDLRIGSEEFRNMQVKPGSIVPLKVEAGIQLDIIADFELDEKDLGSVNKADEAEFSCETSGGTSHRGALGPFGLLVLADDGLTEQTPIYFYVVKTANGSIKTFFCTDQTRSSLASDVNKQIYGSYVPVLEGEKFSLRILVDHSIVESFAQGGRTCITSRVYPTRAIYGAARLFLFNNATDSSVTSSVKIWQLNSAFIRPYTGNY